jgi:hypothetical protein
MRSVGGGRDDTADGTGRSAVGGGRITGGAAGADANSCEPASTGAVGGVESGDRAGASQSHVTHGQAGVDSGAAGFARSPQHRGPVFAAAQQEWWAVDSQQE